MKTATKEQINQLVSYYNTSAYAQTNDITQLAYTLFEEENGYTANSDEEREAIEEIEQDILNDIETSLIGFEYIECENQGSYNRHIWHKI